MTDEEAVRAAEPEICGASSAYPDAPQLHTGCALDKGHDGPHSDGDYSWWPDDDQRSNDPDFRPGRDYLSNGEIKATGLLIGGAVGNICRELLERREADRWIPVSERLPEAKIGESGWPEHRSFLVVQTFLSPPVTKATFVRGNPGSVWEHGSWNLPNVCGGSIDHHITHWRPLPAPPEQGEPQ